MISISINALYHAQYHGDFTAAGTSITGDYTYQWLRAPEITDPAVYQATRSSLLLPATATVDRAFLTWVHDNPFIDPTSSSLYLRTPASASDQLADATFISSSQFETVQPSSSYRYFSYTVDVTDLVRAGGPGDYWVYNTTFAPAYYTIPSKAGWSLYVFYRDDTLSFKDLSYNAGLVGVGPLFEQTELDIVLTDLHTPPEGPVLGRIGVTTYDPTAGEVDSFVVESTPMSDNYTPPNDFANSVSTINNQLMDMWPIQTVPADVNTQEFQTKVIALAGTEVSNNVTQITVHVEVPGPPDNETGAADMVAAIALAFELYSIDLSISKTAAFVNAFPQIGDTVTYTMAIANNSPYATGVNAYFYDALPSTLTYVPGSMRILNNSYGGYTGPLTDPVDSDVGSAIDNTIEINLGPDATSTAGGTLLPGDTVLIDYRAVINNTAEIGQLIKNVGLACASTSDTGEVFIASASASIRVNADASIQKSAAPTHISGGGAVTYTVTVTNTSADPMAWFDVIDTHDSAYFSFVSATLDMPGVVGLPLTPTVAGPNAYRYHVDAATLNAGASATLTIRMLAAANTPAGLYSDTAQLISASPDAPVTPPVPVEVMPHPVFKTASRPAVQPGETVTYAITFVNNTDQPIDQPTLVDAPDSSFFTFVSGQMVVGGSASAVTPRMRNGQLLFDVPGTIPPGESVVLLLTMLAGAGTPPGTYNDMAWAEYGGIVLPPTPPVPVVVPQRPCPPTTPCPPWPCAPGFCRPMACQPKTCYSPVAYSCLCGPTQQQGGCCWPS